MSAETLLVPILLPAVAGLLCLLVARRLPAVARGLLVLATLANLAIAVPLFRQHLSYTTDFAAFDMGLSFRLDPFASFIVLAAAALGFLLALYAAEFMKGKSIAGAFSAFYLFTLAMLQGAVLADHLVTLLFFWEAMLLTLFGMIAIGHAGAYKTAVKAFFINGVTDLCMMVGIGLVFYQAHTFSISQLTASPLDTAGLGGLAFVFLVIGAISKAGSMPFHSWIPDAAVDAPMPFMALMPGAMEKLIGIYFLTRISLHMFALGEGWASMLLMVIGAATILLAVLMALVQKDYKRLLSFHAISQVGYMILGIGTAVPVGIVGGLFHMLNNAMYKSALFLTGGAVERQAGSTDLKAVSGLRVKMPITCLCFIIAALSISGVPPFNGFFSKELVYDGALERGFVFYAIAALGSFFTAASFLKLGHAAFFGPVKAPQDGVREAPWTMLVPMVVIAAGCVLFGVYNPLPIDGLITSTLGMEAGRFSGLPHSVPLVVGTLIVLALAVLNHLWGAKRTGSGLGAVDHIHHAPVMHQMYDAADKRFFDPYEWTMQLVKGAAWAGWAIDRLIDQLYNRVAAGLAMVTASTIRKAHAGSHALYLAWVVLGAALVGAYLVGGF